MNQLLIESFEINGARKVLEKLQHDWAFSITPAVKRGCKPKNPALDDGKNTTTISPWKRNIASWQAMP